MAENYDVTFGNDNGLTSTHVNENQNESAAEQQTVQTEQVTPAPEPAGTPVQGDSMMRDEAGRTAEHDDGLGTSGGAAEARETPPVSGDDQRQETMETRAAEGGSERGNGTAGNTEEADSAGVKNSPKVKFTVHPADGSIVLHGGAGGALSAQMVADSVKAFSEACRSAGMDNPELRTILISEDVKSLTADCFGSLQDIKGLRMDALTVISETGTYTIQTVDNTASPFNVGCPPVKAFVFNEKIPEGMTTERDGRNAPKGILEGSAAAMIIAVNVRDIPERAFALSNASFVDIGPENDFLRIGKEAFSQRVDGTGDKAVYQAIPSFGTNTLSPEAAEKVVGSVAGFIQHVQQLNEGRVKECDFGIAKVRGAIEKAKEAGKDEEVRSLSKELDILSKARSDASKRYRFADSLIGEGNGFSKYGHAIEKTAERGREGRRAVTLHNLSSSINARAFDHCENLALRYVGKAGENECRLRESETRELAETFLKDMGLDVSASSDKGKELVEMVTDYARKAMEKGGKIPSDLERKLDKEGATKRPDAKLFAELADRAGTAYLYRKAYDGDRLFITASGTEVGKEAFAGTGIRGLLEVAGEARKERIMIERGKLEAERSVCEMRLKNKNITPGEIGEVMNQMKKIDAALSADPSSIANLKLSNEAFGRMDELAITNIDWDGEAKNVFKGSGNASAGVRYEGDAKTGEKSALIKTDKENTGKIEYWRPTMGERIGAYIQTYNSLNKMSIYDLTFDIMKNLFILGVFSGASGLEKLCVRGVKLGEGGQEKKFDMPVTLVVKDDIAGRSVAFMSQEGWDRYASFRSAFTDELSKLRKEETANKISGLSDATLKDALARAGVGKQELAGMDRRAMEEKAEQIGESFGRHVAESLKERREALEKMYREGIVTLLDKDRNGRPTDSLDFSGKSFEEMRKLIDDGEGKPETERHLMLIGLNGKAGEAVYVDGENGPRIELRGMDGDGKSGKYILTPGDVERLRGRFSDLRMLADAARSNPKGENLDLNSRYGRVTELVEKLLGKAEAADFRKTAGLDGGNPDDGKLMAKLDDYSRVSGGILQSLRAIEECMQGVPKALSVLEGNRVPGSYGAAADEKTQDTPEGKKITKGDKKESLESSLRTGNLIFGSLIEESGLKTNDAVLGKLAENRDSLLSRVGNAAELKQGKVTLKENVRGKGGQSKADARTRTNESHSQGGEGGGRER